MLYNQKSLKTSKQSFEHTKVNNRQGESKESRKMKSRMRTAGVWQKCRDILPQIFSLSSPFCSSFLKVGQANSKEKAKVDATQ